MICFNVEFVVYSVNQIKKDETTVLACILWCSITSVKRHIKTAFHKVNVLLVTTTYNLAVLELMKHEQNTCIQKVVKEPLLHMALTCVSRNASEVVYKLWHSAGKQRVLLRDWEHCNESKKARNQEFSCSYWVLVNLCNQVLKTYQWSC